MDDRLYEVGVVLSGLAFWAAVYGLMLLVTRPRSPRAAPATPDLGDEPPAVVSLVTNGWDVTEDAAEATLLDLAARGYFEFRQPGNDPRETTVHVLDGPAEDRLTPYERRVLRRVSGLAVGGVVPLTALTFRDLKQAKSWSKSLRDEIVSDARARGLSRRRFTSAVIGVLVAAAAVAMVPVAIGVHHYSERGGGPPDESPWGNAISVCVFAFIVLTALSGKPVGERDTAAGREVAARWFGVRDWLRAHEAFGDLPPAAVTLWDRYLSYGAAVGSTRVSSAVIDLGLGNRKRVWSSFGDTWHQVRVRYPRLARRYGRTPWDLGFRAILSLGAGYLLVRYWAGLIADLSTIDELPVARYGDLASGVGLLLGWVLLAFGSYLAVGVIVDLATPVTITGQVLWVQVWKQHSGGENQPPRPWLYHYAVDDGRSDRTVAWALPADVRGGGGAGATVTFTARRWTRRVLTATIVADAREAAAGVAQQSTMEPPKPASTQRLSGEDPRPT